jgi:CBS domain-containing protein
VQPLSELSTVGPNASATDLLECTQPDDDAFLLVLDGDRFVGTVRRRDLVRGAVRDRVTRR